METNSEQLHLNPDRVYNDATGWLRDGDTFSPIPAYAETLESGVYFIQISKGALAFTKTEIKTDQIFEMKDSIQDTVIGKLESFWSKEAEYKRFGLTYKRGMIFHSRAGCGKTTLLKQICDYLIKKNGIALIATEPNLTIESLSQLRRIEPDRKLAVLFEDFEGYLNGFGEENLLSLFDGQRQIDNVVYLCTTNYLEDIPDRFKHRPSRIDEVIEILPPTSEMRRTFLVKLSEIYSKSFAPLGKSVISDTENFPFAHIKELFISVIVLDYDYKTTLARMKANLIENDADGSGVFGKGYVTTEQEKI